MADGVVSVKDGRTGMIQRVGVLAAYYATTFGLTYALMLLLAQGTMLAYLLMPLVLAAAVLAAHKTYALSTLSLGLNEPPLLTGNVPWVGIASRYAADPPGFFRQMRKEYGDIFTLFMAGTPITVVLDPDFIARFYRPPTTHPLLFVDPLRLIGLTELLGRLSLSNEGAAHVFGILGRRLVPLYRHFPLHFPAVLRRAMQNFMPAGTTVDKSGQGLSVNLWDFVDYLILTASMFACCKDLTWHADAINHMRKLEDWSQVLTKCPGLAGKAVIALANRHRHKLLAQIKAVRDARVASGPSVPGPTEPAELEKLGADEFPDLLDIVMEEIGEDVELQLDTVVGTMFAAVANTDAAGVALLFHIAHDKEVRALVEEEVARVMNAHGGKFSFECLREMVYLEACIMEATRLYAINISMRTAQTSLEVGPYQIPPMRVIAISAQNFMSQGDASAFDQPRTFRPDRFLPDQPSIKAARKNFLGFGQGRHMCKGMDLAKVELKMIVSLLLNGYRVTGMDPGKNAQDGLPDMEWISLGLAYPRNPVMLNLEVREVPLFPVV